MRHTVVCTIQSPNPSDSIVCTLLLINETLVGTSVTDTKL